MPTSLGGFPSGSVDTPLVELELASHVALGWALFPYFSSTKASSSLQLVGSNASAAQKARAEPTASSRTTIVFATPSTVIVTCEKEEGGGQS